MSIVSGADSVDTTGADSVTVGALTGADCISVVSEVDAEEMMVVPSAEVVSGAVGVGVVDTAGAFVASLLGTAVSVVLAVTSVLMLPIFKFPIRAISFPVPVATNIMSMVMNICCSFCIILVLYHFCLVIARLAFIPFSFLSCIFGLSGYTHPLN